MTNSNFDQDEGGGGSGSGLDPLLGVDDDPVSVEKAAEDYRLALFIASSSIIILSLITIIGVVSCFILCNEERELMQEVALDTPLREAYENIIRNLESGGEALTANNDLDAAEDNEMMTGEFKNDNSARFPAFQSEVENGHTRVGGRTTATPAGGRPQAQLQPRLSGFGIDPSSVIAEEVGEEDDDVFNNGGNSRVSSSRGQRRYGEYDCHNRRFSGRRSQGSGGCGGDDGCPDWFPAIAEENYDCGGISDNRHSNEMRRGFMGGRRCRQEETGSEMVMSSNLVSTSEAIMEVGGGGLKDDGEYSNLVGSSCVFDDEATERTLKELERHFQMLRSGEQPLTIAEEKSRWKMRRKSTKSGEANKRSFRERVNLMRISRRVLKRKSGSFPARKQEDDVGETDDKVKIVLKSSSTSAPLPTTATTMNLHDGDDVDPSKPEIEPGPFEQPISPYEGRSYSPALLKASFLQIDPAMLTDQSRLKEVPHSAACRKRRRDADRKVTVNAGTVVGLREQISGDTFVRRKTFFETLANQNV